MVKLTGCSGCRNADASDFEVPFTMAFQPIVDLRQRRIWGYEALVRGRNGASAGEVLSHVTEENRYAFDQACRVMAIDIAASGLSADSTTILSINFMPNAVYEPRACIRSTLAATARTGFDPKRLMFEFTEQEQFVDTSHIAHIVNEYSKMGFKTALDDFGAGFSGLGLLAQFQTDLIKIDMDLIRNIDTSIRRQAILAGIMEMSKGLGLEVLAEGVESEAEALTLLDSGIGLMQGYFFARPQVETFLQTDDVRWPEVVLPNLPRARQATATKAI